ncbi:Endonuclease 4 [Rhynchospora pubera]|uniref:Aspergillus nuclease S1 n=1 Tax=Rhynchospora pubera TaxID=906938 RepID=A0AAV8C074_9POAL|nr:Endonuclease 4 [Rhynchospora pubera]
MGLMIFLCVLLCVLASTPTSNGWGPEGHYIVCKIAESYLTSNARKAVRELLPKDAIDLASVCSWPDEIRKQQKWSTMLHFVDTPGVCNFDYNRDCHSNGVKDFCVVAAIKNYTEQLETYQHSPTYNLTEALMFLSHFVGDIHQPLHCGFVADSGGNTILVNWYDVKTTLHKVWDDNMVQKKMNDSFYGDLITMAKELKMKIDSQDYYAQKVNEWRACGNDAFACAKEFASESIELACSLAYKDVYQYCTLGDYYFTTRISTVEERIMQAAIRLASLLNKIFSNIKEGNSPKISQILRSVSKSVDK